jgi:hypothetical protein
MSSIFEDLNNLITENPIGKVLGIVWLILVLSAVIAGGLVFLLLKFIFRHTA